MKNKTPLEYYKEKGMVNQKVETDLDLENEKLKARAIESVNLDQLKEEEKFNQLFV